MNGKAQWRPAVALVHDWLTGMRGGERVLEALCRLLPQADLYSLIHRPGSTCELIERRRVRTSFLNDLPAVGRYYRLLLPAMPLAAERLDLSRYDLVITSSHCVANGFGGRRAGQVHVCYCHTPMRYAWSALGLYARCVGPLGGAALRALAGYLRAWDRRMARRVDLFVANSAAVAERIRRYYGQQAVVVHPPVDTHYFTPAKHVRREEFYLAVSHHAPYKRIDQAIAACRLADRALKLVGVPPAGRAWRREAGEKLEVLGWVARPVLRELYRRCKALLMPAEEDFGIAAVEAISCGAPVIAYAAGGACQTVRDAAQPEVDNPTGLLYRPQSAEALARAIGRLEGMYDRFDAEAMHAWAERFSPQRFVEGFTRAVAPLLKERGLPLPWSSSTTN